MLPVPLPLLPPELWLEIFIHACPTITSLAVVSTLSRSIRRACWSSGARCRYLIRSKGPATALDFLQYIPPARLYHFPELPTLITLVLKVPTARLVCGAGWMRKGRNGNRLCPILALSELPDEALAAASLRALELDRDTTKYQCLHFFQCSMNALINGRTKVVTALLNRGRPFDEACPAPSEFVNLEPIVRCSPRDPYERCEELLYNWRLQPGAADLSSSIHEAVRHENWRLARLLIGYGHASTKLGPGEFSGFGQEAIAVSG